MKSSLCPLSLVLGVCAFTIGSTVSLAQTDPKKVPQPPSAELKKFDPFLGKYQVSGDFANLPWTGTLELKKAIKGWYIEQIILVKTEGIDREFRILATWDKNVQKYRLWGFQTLPIMPDNGGEIRFEGNEMITEWVSVRPDGSQVTSSNRYRFISKDELEIVSFRQVGGGAAEKIGFLKGTRMLNDEEPAATPPDHSSANSPQPAPEMQSLARAFEGRWSITEKFEPDEWSPNGGVGYGEEVWRSGPGGFTLMEEIHDKRAAGESFGLAITWWDKAKGLQGMWCAGENPKGCDLNPSTVLKWDGKQFVFDTEFPRGGKTFAWHEVFTDITPTSFTQTADVGEKGGPLKRWLTIHGTRVPEASMHATGTSSDEAELRDTTAELTRLAVQAGHAYASRDLPTLERLTADDYIQTDVRGGVLNRSQWLEFVKNRKTELTVESDDVQVSFYGSAAVVRGHWTYTSKGGGKDVTSYSQWTSVWTRYPDGWKRHVFQNTYVNANADRCATEVLH
jgi:ketosteroid isomerase-like protein